MTTDPDFTDARAQAKVTGGDGKNQPGTTVAIIITISIVITTYWKLGEVEGTSQISSSLAQNTLLGKNVLFYKRRHHF